MLVKKERILKSILSIQYPVQKIEICACILDCFSLIVALRATLYPCLITLQYMGLSG